MKYYRKYLEILSINSTHVTSYAMKGVLILKPSRQSMEKISAKQELLVASGILQVIPTKSPEFCQKI